jgi:hypothetical protein
MPSLHSASITNGAFNGPDAPAAKVSGRVVRWFSPWRESPVDQVRGLAAPYLQGGVRGLALHPAVRSPERFPGKAAARARVAAWVGEYLRTRRHSSIGMISPVDCELSAG